MSLAAATSIQVGPVQGKPPEPSRVPDRIRATIDMLSPSPTHSCAAVSVLGKEIVHRCGGMSARVLQLPGASLPTISHTRLMWARMGSEPSTVACAARNCVTPPAGWPLADRQVGDDLVIHAVIGPVRGKGRYHRLRKRPERAVWLRRQPKHLLAEPARRRELTAKKHRPIRRRPRGPRARQR